MPHSKYFSFRGREVCWIIDFEFVELVESETSQSRVGKDALESLVYSSMGGQY